MDSAGSDDIPVKAGWSDACLQCTSSVSMSWDDKSKVNKTQSDDRARQNRTIPTPCALNHSNNYTIGTTRNPAQLLGRARMRLSHIHLPHSFSGLHRPKEKLRSPHS